MLRYGFGIESTKMCRGKVAMQAFIEALQAQIITLSNGGRIQSANFIEGQSGFRIKHDGEAEFENIKARGHIEAITGFFEGTIDSGPLYASNAIQTPEAGITWQAQTPIQTIRDALGIGPIGTNETKIINFSSGSFGTKTGLARLEFSIIVFRTFTTAQGYPFPIVGNKLRIVFNDNTVYTFEANSPANATVNDGKINNILTVGGGVAGKTLKFKDLPGSPEGLALGSVYRNGNQLMIV